MLYKGKIIKFDKEKGYGFIGLATVTKKDETPHLIETKKDIFIHKNNCDNQLKEGMTVLFEIIPSHKFKDKGIFCATNIEIAPTIKVPKVPTEKRIINEKIVKNSLRDFSRTFKKPKKDTFINRMIRNILP